MQHYRGQVSALEGRSWGGGVGTRQRVHGLTDRAAPDPNSPSWFRRCCSLEQGTGKRRG